MEGGRKERERKMQMSIDEKHLINLLNKSKLLLAKDGGHGCTAIRMYVISQNRTLKND